MCVRLIRTTQHFITSHQNRVESCCCIQDILLYEHFCACVGCEIESYCSFVCAHTNTQPHTYANARRTHQHTLAYSWKLESFCCFCLYRIEALARAIHSRRLCIILIRSNRETAYTILHSRAAAKKIYINLYFFFFIIIIVISVIITFVRFVRTRCCCCCCLLSDSGVSVDIYMLDTMHTHSCSLLHTH